MKHTKGEWKIIYRKDDNFGKPINVPDTVRTNDFENNNMMGDYQGCIICSLNDAHGNRPHAYAESEANAKLIAAAPDLLAALGDLITTVSPHIYKLGVKKGFSELVSLEWAKKAIRKATE